MSVNIYLVSKVVGSDGYTKDGTCGKFKGITIFSPSERPYAMSSLESGVPTALTEFVEEISVHENIPIHAGREMGIYEYESARAEIDLVDNGSSKKIAMSYRLRLTTKKLEDARELIHLFRTGNIWPIESFEGPQSGLSRAQLETALQRTRDDLAASKKTYNALREELREFRNNDLGKRWWALCSVERVKDFLGAILIKFPAL